MPPRKLTPEDALKGTVAFSERYVARGPYEFFPEPEVVEVVQQGLAVELAVPHIAAVEIPKPTLGRTREMAVISVGPVHTKA